MILRNITQNHSGLEYSDDIAKNRANFGIFVAKIESWTTIFILVGSPIFGKY